jgi:elongation factor 3
MIMVSHDAGFLERVCTNMLHIDNLKVKHYKGGLSSFVEAVPEAKAFFELRSSDKYKFKFPEPGNLEGITSKGKHIMKMDNISFTYPTAEKPQLNNVSVRVSLSSRVACVGANGAGKSTMIKLLTGELVADKGSGEVWKHPNCRVAYVAQHAFVHIENHLEKTPNEYIRWRYQYGVDKEALKKDDMQATEEELKKMKAKIQVELTDVEGNIRREKRVIKELTNGRRTEKKGKEYEYEVLLEGGFDQKTWLPLAQLKTMGWSKAVKEVDERVASLAAQYNRPLTQAFVEQHIMDVGLEREFGTHTRMSALSGGQKVKVVLAASLWKAPHIIILDEPTNYLDRESLGALADAIKEYDGGIVIVSHNNEFCKACCPETWIVANHTLDVQGDPEWLAQAEKEKVKDKSLDNAELKDAYGNDVTIQTKKVPTKQEMKKLKKSIAKRRKEGEEVWTDEEMEKMGYVMDVA